MAYNRSQKPQKVFTSIEVFLKLNLCPLLLKERALRTLTVSLMSKVSQVDLYLYNLLLIKGCLCSSSSRITCSWVPQKGQRPKH